MRQFSFARRFSPALIFLGLYLSVSTLMAGCALHRFGDASDANSAGSPGAESSADPGALPSKAEPAADAQGDLGFRYDAKTNSCWRDGELGQNPGYLGECGEIRDSEGLSGRDLRNLNLRGAHFDGAKLADADLSGADLTGADFSSTDLNGARLVGANLSSSTLDHSDLKDADLSRARLDQASIEYSSFARAKLQGATLISAKDLNYEPGDFDGALIDGTTLLPCGLHQAELMGMKFAGSESADDSDFSDVRGQRLSLRLDSSMRSSEKALIESDLDALSSMDIEADPKSDFAKLFGGGTTDALVRYFGERVHFVISKSDQNNSSKGVTVAENYSPEWLASVFSGRRAELPFMDGKVRMTSPRVGYLSIDQGYVAMNTLPVARIETLIHEARHSDCAKLPARSEYERLESGDFDGVSDEAKACTHYHSLCPEGHDLAGEPACDDHPWGSYTAGYVFAEGVARDCRNCTEAERQAALAMATDNFGRLSERVQKGLLAGTLPAPVLTSIGEEVGE